MLRIGRREASGRGGAAPGEGKIKVKWSEIVAQGEGDCIAVDADALVLHAVGRQGRKGHAAGNSHVVAAGEGHAQTETPLGVEVLPAEVEKIDSLVRHSYGSAQVGLDGLAGVETEVQPGTGTEGEVHAGRDGVAVLHHQRQADAHVAGGAVVEVIANLCGVAAGHGVVEEHRPGLEAPRAINGNIVDSADGKSGAVIINIMAAAGDCDLHSGADAEAVEVHGRGAGTRGRQT